MSVDGFEDEILALMKKMEQRIRGNAFNSGIKKKKKLGAGSRFERTV